MKSVTVNLPDEMKLDPKDVVKFLAAKLYEAGKLSLGHAADLASLSKVDFSEMLSDHNVSLFNYPASDIKRDSAQF